MTEPYSIGVDLGGTNLRAAGISRDGTMLEKVSGSTPIEAGPEAVISDICQAVEKLRASLGRDNLAGIGAGIPGAIRFDEGVIVAWPNMPSFNGYPVRTSIENRLGAKLFLENDANAAALGEHWKGAGRGAPNLVLLTLGTGIGGGIIIDGRVLHGNLGMAGELGHMTVSPNGNPCGCGNRGCLEKHASATAIAAMGRLLGLRHDVGHDQSRYLTAEDVYTFATTGDARALAVFRAMGEALGIALASLINIFNFPLYLLSGGPLPAWEFFAPAMLAEIERRCYTYRQSPTRIERAQLGNEAGLYGAAYLPLQAAGH